MFVSTHLYISSRLACLVLSCLVLLASGHVKAALANASPATATSTPSTTSGKGAAASAADLRESMSAAVRAIATQSAQILLHNSKVCVFHVAQETATKYLSIGKR